MKDAEPVIRVFGLTRSYAGPPRVDALRDASFDVQVGSFVTVEGPSGSGKSTLLQLLGLLDEPTSGSYLLAGQDTAALGERERCWLRASSIGFVFQSFQLLETRTAVQNVEMALLYRGVGPKEAAARAGEALERVGLGSQVHQQTRTMSGGERQRVAIARALVGDPDVLLCDEPTGNLDSVNGAAVMDLFGDLHAQGATVVLITHDSSIAARGSQRLRIIDGVVR